ncbi:penicillin acylase family protein [Brucella abortus]|nr:penicillin acylase family protein [Brucella abortus]
MGPIARKKGPKRRSTASKQFRYAAARMLQIDVWTTRHGPLILGSPEEGKGIALKSRAAAAERPLAGLSAPMLTASSITEFYDMMEPWGLIDHNLVSADKKGISACWCAQKFRSAIA